ncbi:MAG: PhzF family phenazine biosynthesis isomerase, partial [Geminicoccaceae bacterium]
ARHATFVVPGEASSGTPLDPALVAPVLGLASTDLAGLAPRRAGHGVDFLMVELAGLEALGKARLADMATWPKALAAAGLENGVFLFTRATDDGSIRARMFAPFFGIPEDPATGAAAAALAGLLAATAADAGFDGRWRIVQGVEMGRPSTIDVTATKRAGRVEPVTVAGSAVLLTEGRLYLGD